MVIFLTLPVVDICVENLSWLVRPTLTLVKGCQKYQKIVHAYKCMVTGYVLRVTGDEYVSPTTERSSLSRNYIIPLLKISKKQNSKKDSATLCYLMSTFQIPEPCGDNFSS